MINFLTLRKKLEPYKVKNDSELPWAYQKANPKGRVFHDDWLLFKKTPRIDTAFKVPFPFKMLRGNAIPVERPIPLDYPLSPNAVYAKKPWFDGERDVYMNWVWMVDPIQPAGRWAELAAYLNGEWVKCFFTKSINFFGNKVVHYWGLKPDPNAYDCMAWYPEISFSVKHGTLA